MEKGSAWKRGRNDFANRSAPFSARRLHRPLGFPAARCNATCTPKSLAGSRVEACKFRPSTGRASTASRPPFRPQAGKPRPQAGKPCPLTGRPCPSTLDPIDGEGIPVLPAAPIMGRPLTTPRDGFFPCSGSRRQNRHDRPPFCPRCRQTLNPVTMPPRRRRPGRPSDLFLDRGLLSVVVTAVGKKRIFPAV